MYDVKYAPFADSYIGMAHGDTYEHVKRWLKQRFTFVDTLFDYAPSYNNDVLTIRANTTELMTLEIETYTPVYQHVSWYNGQMDKKKIDGKVSVEFSGTAQAATDQEVLIYGGSNVKSIKGITSMNPNRMLIGSATKLVEIDAHDCPLLADINANKANLSPHEYLNKVNLSNCPLLEGNLRLNNSPLVQEINIKGTNITGMNLPNSIRNLQTLRLPNTMTELTLNDANMLHTLEFDEGVNLQSISMTNCNALENVIGLDLLQTPSITLNNSYNNVAELYFKDTTNLSLSNMSNLERVIFTPNNEYETFELINVANAPNYKVTTFNCPKLSTFMTTAPYRESYNDCDLIEKDTNLLKDISPLVGGYVNWQTGEVSLNNANGTSVTQDYIFLEANNEYTLSSTIDGLKAQVVFYDTSKSNVTSYITDASNVLPYTFTPTEDCYMRFHTNGVSTLNDLSLKSNKIEMVKHYGDIQPNTTFTANSIDISNTQFTDVKLLCTTDTNTLKLPTTVKNFYCDSSFDLDTDYLEDGEYDVVHGELVEPYTTDYEGEVIRIMTEKISICPVDMEAYIYKAQATNDPNNTPIENSNGSICCVDFTRVVPGTYMEGNSEWQNVFFFTEDKVYISAEGWGKTATVPNNAYYFRANFYVGVIDSYILTYSSVCNKTPNLIPSSADGSLIFSMYAPNNTVAPASGTWDLHGLEFDNFHTFGMNNDVKPSDDSYVKAYNGKNLKLFQGNVNRNSPSGSVFIDTNQTYIRVLSPIYLPKGSHTYTYSNGNNSTMYYVTELNGSKSQSLEYGGQINITSEEGGYVHLAYNTNDPNYPNPMEWIKIDDVYYMLENIELITLDHGSSGFEYSVYDYIDGEVDSRETSMMIMDIKSISMTARYDDYNITIKNANISPKTHNTMLYPLLVNEDNPITGTLDYTNYEGNNLSWSFAYVNMNKVNIVQPKDELLNTYEYRYNAFYETEYEFDDPNEVLRYITSSSNLLPTFNEGFTYTYDKLDNNDGTYIYRIYANDPTLLTSFELEKVPYLRITNAENLLSPIDLTKYETVSISESYYDITELYFREATNLTLTNMPYLERVIYLPNDEYEVFEIINVVNSKDYIITTSECPRLTTFMTTASHRESYNNEDVIAEVITEFTNTDNELFTNEYVFSKTYWEEDGTEVQGSVNLLHYEIPSIEDSVKAIHMVQGLDSTNRVTFFNDDKFISCEVITTACELDFKLHRDCNRIVFICEREGIVSSVVESILTTTLVKEYGSVEPNIIFNANTLDISNTQFTDVKLLCTTDLNVLKLPTTVKNFYCDSSFDLDTDYLTDGEYNAVHGELVEQYTTDYEDEVVYIKENEVEVLLRDIDTVWKDGYFLDANGNENSNADRCVSDYIRVVPNTRFILSKDGITQYVNIGALAQYDINKQYITGGNWVNNVTLDTNCAYIRLDHTIVGRDKELLVITFTPYVEYTPNLIPSSSDGSLIFSMYSPSKTVQPASNTWDLYGLEFDNFHTFGMNNDIKIFMKKTQDINFAEAIELDNLEFDLNIELIASANDDRGYIRLCDGFKERVIYINRKSIAYATNIDSWFFTNLKKVDSSSATKLKLSVSEGILTYYLDGVSFYSTNLNNIPYYNDTIYNKISIELVNDGGFDSIISSKTLTSPSNDINDIKSITMTVRYDDYNITIKNANISPKTHNTMLYPLLVNEDKPITGTLDYTNYAGKHLSWSFAYTDEEHVNIIQPKDELINSYKYKYNAFYQTDYEFDSPYEVARYTSSASGVLPSFNKEFTYTYDEIDNGDGTYTIKIYADSLDILPTWLSYQNKTNLLSVEKLKTGVLVSAESMFQGCSSLTSVNISEIDVSSVGQIYRMFYGCTKLTEIQGIENLSNGNFINLWEMFRGCSSLTELDLSGFNTSNVTSMAGMFNGCSELTSLDLSEFDTSNVTNMNNMFCDCSKLKTITGLGDLDTSNVTNIDYMFINDSALETWGLDKWDTSKIETMAQTFRASSIGNDSGIENWKLPNLKGLYFTFAACKNLTRLDISGWVTENTNDINLESTFYTNDKIEYINFENWSHIKFTKLSGTFSGCYALTEIKGIENFDTSKVTHMGGMLQNCKSLTSLDFSGFDTSKVTNMQNMFQNCSKLISLNVSNWSLDKVNTIIPQLSVSPSTSTLYGTVIIDESTLPSGWVYDNVLEVAIYTCNTSGILPNFNTEFTYTHAEVDNGDGTYTTKISADSIDNLPTQISFYNIRELIEVHKLNTSEVTTMQGMFQHCKALTTINSSSWDTSKVISMRYMFNNCSALTTLDVSNWNVSNVVSMYGIFSGCTQLTTLDVGKWNTKNVDTMSQLFSDCPNITTLDVSNFDTSNVTDMNSMFKNCNNLTTLDVSNFDTSNVNNMGGMFDGCKKLTTLDVSNFDTNKVTNMSSMFGSCFILSIEGLGNWDVKNVTDMGGMFLHCRGITSLLEISDWDTSSLKNLYRTFMGCTELIELDVSNWNTSKLETLLEAFYSCSKIISFNLGNWDCRRVTSISGAFQGCSSLSSIVLPKEVGKGCNAVSALRNCTNLKEVVLPKGVGDIAHIFNNCNNLEKAVIPLDNINNTQDSTFNNCIALIDVDWVGDLSNNFNIITNTGEHITTESDIHELMTNLGDLKKDKIKISLSKGMMKVNDAEKTIE